MGDSDIAAVAVGTLQVDTVVDTGQLLFAWGYCPHVGWRSGTVNPPGGNAAQVFARLDGGFARGAAFRVPGSNDWPIVYDRNTGWVEISDGFPVPPTSRYVIAEQSVVGIADGSLAAVWLQPIMTD